MTDRTIHFEIDIRVIAREVWSVLTDAEKIPLWWEGVHAVQLTDPTPGGLYTLNYKSGKPGECHILGFELGKLLRYRWHSSEPAPTEVEYRLIENGASTRVVFLNSGYQSGPEWDRCYDSNFLGWLKMFLGIRKMLEVAHS